MTGWGAKMTEITAITMPKWGLTMTEGKILGWLKAEGDSYRAGEELLETETAETAEESALAPREIDAGGTQLRVLDLGGGEAIPVLLVHGFGADLNSWMFTQP